ncbi:MAG: 6-bladed beta-propeller [Bacteroidales bacterium]|nr:6-bladed beta-propeller [Bacteroidales bacterium]
MKTNFPLSTLILWNILAVSCSNISEKSSSINPLDDTFLQQAKEIVIKDFSFDYKQFFQSDYYKEGAFNYSDLYSQIDYISLESVDEYEIGSFDKIIITENGDFIILDWHQGIIIRYDSQGKFLNTIGQRGHSKKEYVSLSDIQYNETLKQVFVIDRSRTCLKVYSIDGRFVKDIDLGYYFDTFGIVDDNHFVVFRNYAENPQGDETAYNYKMYDMDGNLVQQWCPYHSNRNGYMTTYNNVFLFQNGKLYCKEQYSSSVFTFENNMIKPLYNLNFGTKQIPQQLVLTANEEKMEDWLRNHPSLQCNVFFESKDKIVLQLIYNCQVLITYIQDKKETDNVTVKLTGYNDMKGLLDKNTFNFFQNNKMYYIFDSYEVKNRLDDIKSQTEWIEKTRGKIKASDIELLTQLSKTNNTIIQICTLK